MNSNSFVLAAALPLIAFSQPFSRGAIPHTAERYDHGEPTNYEQLMLELMNRSRANPVAEAARHGLSNLNSGLTAGTISTSPKQPLAFQPHMILAARDHTDWMLSAQKFQHQGPDARRADGSARLVDAGYVFDGNWGWAENISWGSPGGSVDPNAVTIDAHRRFFLSAGHRRNICNPMYDEAGVGLRIGNYSGGNGLMATEDFAVSSWSPGPVVTGVVFIDADNDSFYDPGEGVSGVRIEPENGEWFGVTSTSGGYAVPYPAGSGSLKVTFSGSVLRRPMTAVVVRAGVNVKLDLIPAQPDIDSVPHFVDGSLSMNDGMEFTAQVAGRPGAVFTVEHSKDLRLWLSAGTFTLSQHTILFLHQPGNADAGFYRLRR